MNILFDRILSLCTKHNITPGKLCAELDMSRSVLSDLKSGRKKSLNAETAYSIAACFGVSVGYLLGKMPASTVAEEDIKQPFSAGAMSRRKHTRKPCATPDTL